MYIPSVAPHPHHPQLIWESIRETLQRDTGALSQDLIVCDAKQLLERYEESCQCQRKQEGRAALLQKVLCKENFEGHRGYWEVDYDGWVVIGLICESAPRKSQDGPCGMGENSGSWGAGWSGSCYQVWHNGENVDVQLPLSSTMGIYIDQPAGIIKFLLVEGEGEKEVRLIHKFKVKIQEKVFPGFWVGTNSFCLLRKKDQ
ncbi:uncharacterized protein V6R79_020477 [Siganus canaliculatus]